LVANVHLEGIEEARMASLSKSERVPKPMQATFNAIVALIDFTTTTHVGSPHASKVVWSSQTLQALRRNIPLDDLSRRAHPN